MANNSLNSPCPCHSGKLYETCCYRFHVGKAHAPTPLALMRSRYAAYALGLSDYIIQTTHPENPGFQKDTAKWQKEIEFFSQHTLFQKLEILDANDSEPLAYVIFRAHLMQRGQDASFTEKSFFKKQNGYWLYLSGTPI